MRRACSSDVSAVRLPSGSRESLEVPIEPEPRDLPRYRGWNELVDRLAACDARANLRRADRCRLDLEDLDAIRAGQLRRENVTGPPGDPERAIASTSSDSFQLGNSESWSAPITRIGSSNRRARSMSIVRGARRAPRRVRETPAPRAASASLRERRPFDGPDRRPRARAPRRTQNDVRLLAAGPHGRCGVDRKRRRGCPCSLVLHHLAFDLDLAPNAHPCGP